MFPFAGTGSSSDEPEYTKTLEIITRLSQKYLNTGQKSSKKGNDNSQERGYEGDEENTSGSQVSSSGSPYDFEDEAMSEDSPSEKKKKSKKSEKKTNKQSKTSKKSQSIKISPQTKQDINKKVTPPRTQDKSVRFSGDFDSADKEKVKLPKTPFPKTPVLALEKIDVQMIEESQRQLRKRKVDTPEPVSTVTKVTKDSVERIKTEPKNKVTKIDTSVILPSTRKIIPEMVQDSSTPNEIVRTKTLRKSGNDSCFGFDEIKRTSLPVSPVRRLPITPLSDYASMDTFSREVSMEDSIEKSKAPSPTLFSMEEDDFNDLQVNKSTSKSYSKQKKRIYTKKQQVAKSNEWAEKMNIELQEIESFELSIEQD